MRGMGADHQAIDRVSPLQEAIWQGSSQRLTHSLTHSYTYQPCGFRVCEQLVIPFEQISRISIETNVAFPNGISVERSGGSRVRQGATSQQPLPNAANNQHAHSTRLLWFHTGC